MKRRTPEGAKACPPRGREASAPSESFLEKILAADLDRNRIRYVREYKFHPHRRWLSDFMLPDLGILIEVEGWGRHQTFIGYEKDCEKYNAAVCQGWRLLRYTGRMVKNGSAIKDLLELKEKAADPGPA